MVRRSVVHGAARPLLLLQYVIFPGQFLFLYSYHPTGGMGELPRRLETAWRERHRVGAEEAFARIADGGEQTVAPSFFAKAEAGAAEAGDAAAEPVGA